MNLGEYYPRVYRPIFDNKKNIRIPLLYETYLTYDSAQQLKYLIEIQDSIFRTIHPHKDNFSCFGIAIRNLLFLSCTELEAQFTGVLKANGIIKQRYTTHDFIKLEPIFKLKEYSVKFSNYPWFGNFSPFTNWSSKQPTKSLGWYDNYNSVKHDRYNEFKKGNLMSALMSIVGLAIILKAQFSHDEFIVKKLGETFDFISIPKWIEEEQYLPPSKDTGWNLIKRFI